MVSNATGKQYYYFKKWASLNTTDPTPYMPSPFVQTIDTVIKNNLRWSFYKIKEGWQESVNLRKRAIQKLIYNTMAENKRMFMDWREQTKIWKLLLRSKRCL